MKTPEGLLPRLSCRGRSDFCTNVKSQGISGSKHRMLDNGANQRPSAFKLAQIVLAFLISVHSRNKLKSVHMRGMTSFTKEAMAA